MCTCRILHFVEAEYETSPLTLRRIFENSVSCKIFGPKKEDVTRDWRKLHNKDLHKFQSSPNVMRVMKSNRNRWVGGVADNGRGENCVCGCGWKI